MVKKIAFVSLVVFMSSCNSTKNVVRTNKPSQGANLPITNTTQNTTNTTTTNHTTEVLKATSSVKVTREIVLKYISDYKDIAKINMKEHGVPASITIAQGILESGSGQGSLCLNANNHFGIKCHKEWNGPSVRHDDDEAQECFRKYEKSEDSFKDHSYFLTSRPRYGGLFLLDKDNYKGWAKGLKDAGYATDPKYSEKLISIIERYQLHQYDAEVLGKEFKIANPIVNSNSGVLNVGGYQVEKGDTLYSLSKKFNISIEELKLKNNLQTNYLSIGQSLIVK